MPREGQTGTDPTTGRAVVYRGGRVVFADNPTQAAGASAGAGSVQRSFNSALGKIDAEAVSNLRQMAGGALGRISQAESALNNLPRTPTGIGAGIGAKLSTIPVLNRLPGVPTQAQVARAGDLDALSSGNVMRDAAAIKPISNSDIVFLQSFQAGSARGTEENRRRLIAQQWFDAKVLGQSRAMEQWIRAYGSPSAPNRSGLSFDAWWQDYGNRAYPRPVFDGRGSHGGFTGYRPPRRGQSAPQSSSRRSTGARIISVED